MTTNESQKSVGLLNRLIGEQLCAVTFIMDYVQLQFNNSLLTVLNPIFVEVDNQTCTADAKSFRSSLCERILRNVKNIVLSKEILQVHFDDSAIFLISLKEEDYSGAEALNFNFWEDGEERFVVI